MECIPPPCPKLEEGIGQVGDVIVVEPGNKYTPPTAEGELGSYNVVNNITSWVVIDSGTNYGPNDKLEIDIPDVGIVTTTLELKEFGGISSVTWPPPPPDREGDDVPPPPPPPPGITTYPSFRITSPPPLITPTGIPGTSMITGTPPPGRPGDPDTPEGMTSTVAPPPTLDQPTRPTDDIGTGPPPAGGPGDPSIGDGTATLTPGTTGVNAKVVPIITPTVLLPDGIDPRTGMRVPSNQIIQVTDLVGLKQTGWYNGKEYYGAVFYKDGVRYAGYYETPGVLIRVYSTKQESIDALVTTPPSAILRQGTDVSSNDPRLNIPGTPQ